MTIATTVTFHGTDASPALRSHVLEHAQHLERFADDISSCHVVIEHAERRHRRCNRFDVHCSVAMRGRRIDAGSTPTASHSHADPYVAVSDTFEALRRRIEDYVHRRRGAVKIPPET